MRLTLIYPSVGRKENTPYVRAWQMEPLSMALLAGLTPSDVDLRFYDDRMEEIPIDEETDLVAISVETYTARRASQIAERFRERGVPVVAGEDDGLSEPVATFDLVTVLHEVLERLVHGVLVEQPVVDCRGVDPLGDGFGLGLVTPVQALPLLLLLFRE